MKNDSRSCLVAQVETEHARPSFGKDYGVSFTNEIDVWSQIEFRACHQIRHMRQSGRHKAWCSPAYSDTLVYSTTLRLEE